MAASLPQFTLVASCLAMLVACSSNPTPTPVAPVPTAASNATPSAPTASAPSQTPSSPTQVRIDDAILKACGIKADRAFFAFDSAKLDDTDAGPLGDVARCFTTGPLRGKSLKLVGHADPRGEHEYNMVLGQSRADTVEGFLKAKGLEKSRISTTSRGAADANGTDESTWAKDRRVDVQLGS